MPLNVAFLGSGNGSAFKALHPLIQNESLLNISLVVTNKNCPMLDYAKHHQIPNQVVYSKNQTRECFERNLSLLLSETNIHLIVLVGFMRILSPYFIDLWQDKIINVHPSLLPKHKGLMDLAVHQAVINNQEKLSGCSVHQVTEKVDDGKVLMQKKCMVYSTDNAVTLKKRVQAMEAPLILKTLLALAEKNLEKSNVI